MPEIHSLGKHRFTQLLKNYRAEWGWKLAVRGWTQEIEPPYRKAEPIIFRLPKNMALVYGRWIGEVSDEETALNTAIQGRVLADEDFQEGWQPAAYQAPEESGWDFESRTYHLG